MSFTQFRFVMTEAPFRRYILSPMIVVLRIIRTKIFQYRTSSFRSHLSDLSSLHNPIFVKIGANDGITGDPCSDILLKSSSWTGLLVEPAPFCADKLKINFADTSRFSIEQSAISRKPGFVAFYYVDRDAINHIPSLPEWYDQLGSFDKNHILKHFGEKIKPFIRECKVRACTLIDAFKKNHIDSLHFLHIDTEGYDYEVLKMLDFSRYRPIIIYIEHKHLSDTDKSAMRLLLHSNGYTIYDCGMDYFALHKANYKACIHPCSKPQGILQVFS